MQSGNRTRLYLNEVATRDGFQMEGRFIPTDDKVALIDRLSGLGYAKIEVTSFTSPKAIPALADGEAVMQRIRREPGVVPKLSATPGRIQHAAPNLGQHDADLQRGGGWPARQS